MRGICSPENIADFRILIMLQNLRSNFNFGWYVFCVQKAVSDKNTEMRSVKLNRNSAGSKICQLQKGFDQLFWNYDFRAVFCIGIKAVSKLCALAAVCRMKVFKKIFSCWVRDKLFIPNGAGNGEAFFETDLKPVAWQEVENWFFVSALDGRGKPVRKEGRRGESVSE